MTIDLGARSFERELSEHRKCHECNTGGQAHNLKVLGSNPSPATNFKPLGSQCFQGVFRFSASCSSPLSFAIILRHFPPFAAVSVEHS